MIFSCTVFVLFWWSDVDFGKDTVNNGNLKETTKMKERESRNNTNVQNSILSSSRGKYSNTVQTTDCTSLVNGNDREKSTRLGQSSRLRTRTNMNCNLSLTQPCGQSCMYFSALLLSFLVCCN